MWQDSLPRQCFLCEWVAGGPKLEQSQITVVKSILLFYKSYLRTSCILNGPFEQLTHQNNMNNHNNKR